MKTTLARIFLLLILLVAFYFFITNIRSTEPPSEPMEEVAEMMTGEPSEDVTGASPASFPDALDIELAGDLHDVTGGEAFGTARAGKDNNGYYLGATFFKLPPLEDDYFYEGWVVRRDPFDFISTGEIKMTGGGLVNSYSSEVDYIDYDFYVLTLEPDDGDPAPAAHIVEGELKSL